MGLQWWRTNCLQSQWPEGGEAGEVLSPAQRAQRLGGAGALAAPWATGDEGVVVETRMGGETAIDGEDMFDRHLLWKESLSFIFLTSSSDVSVSLDVDADADEESVVLVVLLFVVVVVVTAAVFVDVIVDVSFDVCGDLSVVSAVMGMGDEIFAGSGVVVVICF